jgi:hypothetical protein
MKITIMFILLGCSQFGSGQTTTTVVELGKVGGLNFSFAKTDTVYTVSISQNKSYDIRAVVIPQSEIAEVVQTLNFFAAETANKVAGQTVITRTTKSLLLTCSYFKDSGWFVMIQNTDPAFEQTSEVIQRKTGYQVNHFVEIKPKQLPEVVKMFSKVPPKI